MKDKKYSWRKAAGCGFMFGLILLALFHFKILIPLFILIEITGIPFLVVLSVGYDLFGINGGDLVLVPVMYGFFAFFHLFTWSALFVGIHRLTYRYSMPVQVVAYAASICLLGFIAYHLGIFLFSST